LTVVGCYGSFTDIPSRKNDLILKVGERQAMACTFFACFAE